jgi:hypothetical protein
MLPQEVIVMDSATGALVAGIPVTWTDGSVYPVYASLSPYGKTTIVTFSNAEGIAQAVSTEQCYQGNGFDACSMVLGIKKNLSLTATIEGADDPVAFYVIVATCPIVALPLMLTITVTSETQLELQLVESQRAAGRIAEPPFPLPWDIVVTDANGKLSRACC